MVLMVWDGSYELTLVADASYTVKGMKNLSRRKNSRGQNRDIWTLIYSEIDKEQGTGILTVMKVKPHIDGKQAYCRDIPAGRIMVNELADFAADVYSDHFGKCGADKAKLYAAEAILLRVCKRISTLEASLREHSTDVPLVAADIVTSCETLGERRRVELHEATDQKVKVIASK